MCLQAKIEDALSPDKRDHVRSFNMQPRDFSTTTATSLCHRMANLTAIRVTDVNLAKLHLTAELTPKLEDLALRNVPQECDFNVAVPTLRSVSIQHYEPCQGALPINNMLAAATRLETFETYKERLLQDVRKFLGFSDPCPQFGNYTKYGEIGTP